MTMEYWNGEMMERRNGEILKLKSRNDGKSHQILKYVMKGLSRLKKNEAFRS